MWTIRVEDTQGRDLVLQILRSHDVNDEADRGTFTSKLNLFKVSRLCHALPDCSLAFASLVVVYCALHIPVYLCLTASK